MADSRPVATQLHGPHKYHVYICGDSNEANVSRFKADMEARVEGLLTCDRPLALGELQKQVWRSVAVVFVNNTPTEAEIQTAREKVKYFGVKFAVVITDSPYITTALGKLHEFIPVSLKEFAAFMEGKKTHEKLSWLGNTAILSIIYYDSNFFFILYLQLANVDVYLFNFSCLLVCLTMVMIDCVKENV